MNFKLFTPFALGLTFSLVIFDYHIAQGQYYPCSSWNCGGDLGGYGWGYGDLPADQLVKIEDLVRLKQATLNDYLLLANHYGAKQNYSQAETYFDKVLELSRKNEDLKGQAIANVGLAKVLTLSGRKQEAGSRFIKARKLYNQLGDQNKVMQLNQQIKDINKLKIQQTRP